MQRRVVLALALGESLIVLTGSVLAIFDRGFDGLYGLDAFAYTDYALGPLTTALSHGQLPPDFFWPPAFPMVIAAIGALGLGDRAGQVVALICGSALPFLVVLVGRQIPIRDDERTRDVAALVAGLIVALASHLWQSSIVAMADTMGAALATLGVWAAFRYSRGAGWPLIALSAAAFAVAIQTRWVYGLVALPFVALTLWQVINRLRDRNWIDAATGFTAGALAALVFLIPAGLPIAIALANGQAPPFTGDFAVYSWNPFGALSTSFETPDGTLSYTLPTGVFYLLQPLQPYWLGALGLFLVPGVASVARRPDRFRVAVLAWLFVVIAFHVGGAYQNTRFFLAALPAAAIVAAIGVMETYRYVRDRVWRDRESSSASSGSLIRRAFTWLLVGAVIVNVLYSESFARSFAFRQMLDLSSIRELAALTEPHARIISLGATPVLRHDGRDVVELYSLEPAEARALVADDRPSYVLADAYSVLHQFGELPAGSTFVALTTEPGLTPVRTLANWTLYAVAD
jgi:hypothetical protein